MNYFVCIIGLGQQMGARCLVVREGKKGWRVLVCAAYRYYISQVYTFDGSPHEYIDSVDDHEAIGSLLVQPSWNQRYHRM